MVRHVVGYHSGTAEGCDAFENRGNLELADGDNLWLGGGMYFWDNLGCAEGWKKKRELEAIVGAELCTDALIDLTDPSQRSQIGQIMDRAAKSFRKTHSVKGKKQYFGDVLDFILDDPLYGPAVGPVGVIKAIGTHGWEGMNDRSFADMCWPDDPHLIFDANVEYCVKSEKAVGRRFWPSDQ